MKVLFTMEKNYCTILKTMVHLLYKKTMECCFTIEKTMILYLKLWNYSKL